MYLFTALVCVCVLINSVHSTTTTTSTSTTSASSSISEKLRLQRSALLQKKKLALVDTVIVHLISSSTASNSASSSSISSDSASTLLSSPSSQSSVSIAASSVASETFQSPSASCVEGTSYWDPIKSQCSNCTVECPTGAYVSRQCNRQHDTECQCPKGAFLSLPDGACKPCAQCPSGYGVWRTCRWSRNTVCRKCQPGTYSGVSVGTLGCIPCTKCGPNQEMIAECDGNRDTVCLDRNSLRSNYSLYFSGEITAAAAAKAQEDEEADVLQNDKPSLPEAHHKPQPLFRWNSAQDIRSSSVSTSSYVLPVYFTCLVIIVFAGSIYAFVQFRCVAGSGELRTVKVIDDRKLNHTTTIQPVLHSHLHSRAQHLPPTMAFVPHLYPAPFESHPEVQPVSYMHLYPTVPTQWRHPVESRDIQNPPKLYQNGPSKYKAYYELLYAPYECEQSATSTSASSVASSVKKFKILDELEQKLGNDLVSWEMLARDFGYNDEQIVALECQEENRKNSVQTVAKLLTNWASKCGGVKQEESLTRDDIEQLLCDAEKAEQLASTLVRIGRIDCARLLRCSTVTTTTTSTATSHSVSSTSDDKPQESL